MLPVTFRERLTTYSSWSLYLERNEGVSVRTISTQAKTNRAWRLGTIALRRQPNTTLMRLESFTVAISPGYTGIFWPERGIPTWRRI